MKIIKRGKIEHLVECNNCHTEMQYDKYDLQWTHTDDQYYYIICPVCGKLIWILGNEELDQMYHEAQEEKQVSTSPEIESEGTNVEHDFADAFATMIFSNYKTKIDCIENFIKDKGLWEDYREFEKRSIEKLRCAKNSLTQGLLWKK